MLAAWVWFALLSAPPQESEPEPLRAEAPAEADAVRERMPDRPPAKLLRAPKIPALGSAQAWITLNSWSEWFNENYDGIAGNEGFVTLVNRLNFGVDTRLRKGVSVAVASRIDTQTTFFPQGHVCDLDEDGVLSEAERAACRFGDDYRLERLSLRLTSRHVDVTLGDFNVQFGRGIPLSVRNVDQLGIDPTIKGARVDVHTKVLELTALAGYANRANSDYATRQLVADPGYPALGSSRCAVDRHAPGSPWRLGNPIWSTCSDFVAGARIEAKLPAKLRLAGHYAFLDFGERIATALDERLHVAGGDLSSKRIAGVWDMFVGGAASIRTRDAPELDVPALEGVDYVGHAAFLANNFYLGPGTTLVVEAKHYRDFMIAAQPTRVQYSEAPTLEREDQQVPGNFTSTGGRVRLDHTWQDLGLTLFANTMAYAFAEQLQRDAFSREHGLIATHSFAGAIYRRRYATAQVSFGYRYEFHRDDGRFRRRFPHAELYLNVPLARTRGLIHSATVAFEARFEDKQVTGFADEQFVYGQSVLGYALAPYLQISFIGGFSTEFPALPGALDFTGEPCSVAAGERCKPHLWPGAELKLTVAGNNFVRIFAGRQVGGRVCVNGSCRVLPDFEGVRAELVLSF
jgi:hypothetical protein